MPPRVKICAKHLYIYKISITLQRRIINYFKLVGQGFMCFIAQKIDAYNDGGICGVERISIWSCPPQFTFRACPQCLLPHFSNLLLIKGSSCQCSQTCHMVEPSCEETTFTINNLCASIARKQCSQSQNKSMKLTYNA